MGACESLQPLLTDTAQQNINGHQQWLYMAAKMVQMMQFLISVKDNTPGLKCTVHRGILYIFNYFFGFLL